MISSNRISMVLLLLLVIGGILFALYSVLQIFFSESLYPPKGTIAYYLTITSETIRQVPLVNLSEGPTYYYSCGDGPKPPMQGVFFSSVASSGRVFQTLHQYCLDQGFKPFRCSSETRSADYQKEQRFLSLNVEESPGSPVKVQLLENE